MKRTSKSIVGKFDSCWLCVCVRFNIFQHILISFSKWKNAKLRNDHGLCGKNQHLWIPSRYYRLPTANEHWKTLCEKGNLSYVNTFDIRVFTNHENNFRSTEFECWSFHKSSKCIRYNNLRVSTEHIMIFRHFFPYSKKYIIF